MKADTFTCLSEDAFQIDRMVPMLKVLLDTALGIQKAIDKCLKPIISKLSEGIKKVIHFDQPLVSS